MDRFNGQIWIDKNSPNRLKYYVKGAEGAEGNEYEVVVSQNYKPSDENGELTVGSVVALADGGTIAKAHFPNDINKVIGLAGPKTDGFYPIVTSGTLIVESGVFYDNKDDIKAGCPVYWFIGKTIVNEDGSYTTIDCCDDNCGKLTVSTPSVEDCNVGYDNLPTVGVISKVKDGKIHISVNFTGFENTLGWSWPLSGNGNIAKGEDNVGSVTIRHGLFHSSEDGLLKPRCFCSIVALDENNDTEYQVSAAVDNYYEVEEVEGGNSDRKTIITVKTPDNFRYTVHGTVVYNLGKTAEESK